MAVLQKEEVLMGLECRSGGHYTTSGSVHIIGQLFKIVHYTVDEETLELDYDSIAQQAREVGPKAIFCGETSYSLLWDYPRLREIADEVGAILIVEPQPTRPCAARGAA